MGMTWTEKIREALLSRRIRYHDEKELQDHIETIFKEEGIPFVREFILPENRGRFDFFVDGRIVVEVKIKGSTLALIRQLYGYAQEAICEELVVVTTRNKHRELPSSIDEKPVTVICLSWL